MQSLAQAAAAHALTLRWLLELSAHSAQAACMGRSTRTSPQGWIRGAANFLHSHTEWLSACFCPVAKDRLRWKRGRMDSSLRQACNNHLARTERHRPSLCLAVSSQVQLPHKHSGWQVTQTHTPRCHHGQEDAHRTANRCARNPVSLARGWSLAATAPRARLSGRTSSSVVTCSLNKLQTRLSAGIWTGLLREGSLQCNLRPQSSNATDIAHVR